MILVESVIIHEESQVNTLKLILQWKKNHLEYTFQHVFLLVDTTSPRDSKTQRPCTRPDVSSTSVAWMNLEELNMASDLKNHVILALDADIYLSI